MKLKLKRKELNEPLQQITGLKYKDQLNNAKLIQFINRYIAENHLQTSERMYVSIDSLLAKLASKLEEDQVITIVELHKELSVIIGH